MCILWKPTFYLHAVHVSQVNTMLLHTMTDIMHVFQDCVATRSYVITIDCKSRKIINPDCYSDYLILNNALYLLTTQYAKTHYCYQHLTSECSHHMASGLYIVEQ